MNHDDTILESIHLVRVHLTSLVVTATLPPMAGFDAVNDHTRVILADLHTAMLRVQGNRSPQSSISWPDLRLLLVGYLRVYLAHLEKEV